MTGPDSPPNTNTNTNTGRSDPGPAILRRPATRHIATIAVPALLLVVITAWAFAPVADNRLVNWDDNINFRDNYAFRGLAPANIRWAFSTTLLGVYQPLAWLLLELQFCSWGLAPLGYHLSSLALHVLNSGLLSYLSFLVIEAVGQAHRDGGPAPSKAWARWCAALAAGLFAAHPLRVEVVAWASCQPYLPCLAFYELAVICYLLASRPGCRRRGAWLAASWSCFAASLLFKAVSVTLPIVLILLDFYPLGRYRGGATRRSSGRAVRAVLEKVPFLALALVFAALALSAKQSNRSLAQLKYYGLDQRIAQACYGICFYVAKTVFPVGLSPYYPLPPDIGLGSLPFIVALISVGCVSVMAVYRWRRSPGALVAWVGFVALLGPNLGLARIGNQVAADRYSYAAAALVSASLACGLAGAFATSSRRSKAVVMAAGLGICAILAAASRRQCLTWHDSETLWIRAIAASGIRDAMILNNAGVASLEAEKYDQAVSYFAAALEVDPGLSDAHNNAGSILARRGDLVGAAGLFGEAIRISPDHIHAHRNLALILARQGRRGEAMEEILTALRIDPAYAPAHRTLGELLAEEGRYGPAESHLATALRLAPGQAEVHRALGMVLASQERLPEATAELRSAVRLAPDDLASHWQLARVLARRRLASEAALELAAAFGRGEGLARLARALDTLRTPEGKVRYVRLLASRLLLRQRTLSVAWRRGRSLSSPLSTVAGDRPDGARSEGRGP